MASELEREAQQAITLIKSFSLDLEDYGPESQVLYWLNQYRAAWIRDAIIEAVYQGRYKIISVQNILDLWQRRGQPVRHFTSGFEQVIAAQLGTPLHLSTSMLSAPSRPIGEPTSGNRRLAATKPASLGNRVNSMPPPSTDHGEAGRISARLSSSIEAFPVEAKDTLVEVYQANPSYGGSIDAANRAHRKHGLGDEKTMYASRYIAPNTSSPIQVFRPQPRSKSPTRL